MSVTHREVWIPAEGLNLPGNLGLPGKVRDCVVFAQNSTRVFNFPRLAARPRPSAQGVVGPLVSGVTHLFKEPGCLGAVAEAARDGFLEHFPKGPRNVP